MGAHWFPLLPLPETSKDLSTSPLSPSCSSSCSTCAKAGAEVSDTIANIAANNINFFKFWPSLYNANLYYTGYSFTDTARRQRQNTVLFIFLKKTPYFMERMSLAVQPPASAASSVGSRILK